MGSHIIRIFDPTRYGTQALTFRFNGPRHRFDHHRGLATSPQDDPERGIYYAAFTLSGCLVEYFGDLGAIEINQQLVCRVEVTRSIKLLDLRGSGAMKAGSVAALSKTADRVLSQEWSSYFYENEMTYSRIDGIIYFNAHNDEEAMPSAVCSSTMLRKRKATIALYERAQNGLKTHSNQILRLDDPQLRPAIQAAALENNLIFV